MRRAQFTFEFVILVAMALVIGFVFLSVVAVTFKERSEEQRILAMNDVGYMIQDELILATIVEDGYIREFTVPEKAGRFTYTLAKEGNAISLSSGSVVLTFELPLHSGTISKGQNVLTKQGAVIIT